MKKRKLAELQASLAAGYFAPLSPADRRRCSDDWDIRPDYTVSAMLASVLSDRGAGAFRAARAPRRQRGSDGWRQYAVSRCSALDAGQRPDVQAFRRDVLRDTLLAPEDVPGWVQARAARRGEGFIEYAAPGDEWVRVAAVGRRGRLAQLQRLVQALTEQYRWAEDAAVAFVLTGLTPLVPIVRRTLQRRSNWPCHGRIVLSLDPSLTPDQVRQAFADAKRDFFGGQRKRIKPVGEHAARLAVFVMGHVATLPDSPDSGTGRRAMLRRLQAHVPDLWRHWMTSPERRRLRRTRKVPEYKHASRFWRDVDTAIESLLFLRPVRPR